MITFPQALDSLLAATPLLPTERIRIENAAGRVLRQDIVADRDFPPFDRVMMDGYALRKADLDGMRDFTFIASAPAGVPVVPLPESAGACIEVMTGAPLPTGADCIVPVEETERLGDVVRIASGFDAVPHRFIHSFGSDAKAGASLLNGGKLIGSREIGVAASCGAAWLEVSKLPRISLLATGDELVAVDEIPAPHQIRQSNAHSISCALSRAGYPVISAGCLRDEGDTHETHLRKLLGESDWIILTGAVSKGARDFIPALLDRLGCRRLFHGVSQRPGKPAGCWLGSAGQVIMALPGNPVSALTGLHTFVLPALAVSSGIAPPPKPRLVLPQGKIDGLSGMTQHLPVSLTADGKVSPAPTGNSGDFIGLLRSDGYITIPPREEFAASYPFTHWI
jgi:molybdopterin molybdotransferase